MSKYSSSQLVSELFETSGMRSRKEKAAQFLQNVQEGACFPLNSRLELVSRATIDIGGMRYIDLPDILAMDKTFANAKDEKGRGGVENVRATINKIVGSDNIEALKQSDKSFEKLVESMIQTEAKALLKNNPTNSRTKLYAENLIKHGTELIQRYSKEPFFNPKFVEYLLNKGHKDVAQEMVKHNPSVEKIISEKLDISILKALKRGEGLSDGDFFRPGVFNKIVKGGVVFEKDATDPKDASKALTGEVKDWLLEEYSKLPSESKKEIDELFKASKVQLGLKEAKDITFGDYLESKGAKTVAQAQEILPVANPVTIEAVNVNPIDMANVSASVAQELKKIKTETKSSWKKLTQDTLGIKSRGIIKWIQGKGSTTKGRGE